MPYQQHADDRVDDVFSFAIGRCEDETLLRLNGALDALSVAQGWLALELALAAGQPTVVDCDGLEFLDAAGIRFLAAARERAQATGGELMLRSPPPVIRRVLEITGCQSLIGLPGPGVLGTFVPFAHDPGSAYRAALAAALRIGGATMGNLQLVDATTGELRIVAHHGFGPPFLRYFASVHDAGSACGTALRRGAAVWVSDVATSQIFAGSKARDVMLDAGSRAVASLPVRGPDGELIAMISAHRDHAAPWPSVPRFQLEQLARATGRLVARPAACRSPAQGQPR